MPPNPLAKLKPPSTLASWHKREFGFTSSSIHLGGVTLGKGVDYRALEERNNEAEALSCKDRQQLAEVQRRNA